EQRIAGVSQNSQVLVQKSAELPVVRQRQSHLIQQPKRAFQQRNSAVHVAQLHPDFGLVLLKQDGAPFARERLGVSRAGLVLLRFQIRGERFLRPLRFVQIEGGGVVHVGGVPEELRISRARRQY